VQRTLESYGHAVTVGVPFTQFDGTVSLDAYDAIYLQANANWSSGDMPVPGQRQLINWVNCGGGLVTVEWTTWKIGSGGFPLMEHVLPARAPRAHAARRRAGHRDVHEGHGGPHAERGAAGQLHVHDRQPGRHRVVPQPAARR